ncbi:SapC family protein [Brevundimonas denitrificans]|nr:SapC family protein [Brevundimonas denitrificans]
MERHGKLGVNQAEKPYAFVAGTNTVPLTVTEFSPAALSFPVVFLGEPKSPVAIMALRQDQNLFVDEAGQYLSSAYLPAFVRRYPFVFANDEENKRMVLCIDRGAPFIAEGGQVPLFDGDKPSAFTEQAMQFCNDFEMERQRTTRFVAMLEELDLFEIKEATYTPRNPDGSPGPVQKLAQYYAVSEDKLKALPAEKLAELRDNGALGQIYAHLVSLLGWDRLVAMTLDRAGPVPAAANA